MIDLEKIKAREKYRLACIREHARNAESKEAAAAWSAAAAEIRRMIEVRAEIERFVRALSKEEHRDGAV